MQTWNEIKESKAPDDEKSTDINNIPNGLGSFDSVQKNDSNKFTIDTRL